MLLSVSCDMCKGFFKETFFEMNKFPKKEPIVAAAVRSFHQSDRSISFLRSKFYYQYSSDDIFSQGGGS